MEEIQEYTLDESVEFSAIGNGFNFKLNDFEGPLDLLLELVKSKGMDILNIQISQITDQYLEILKTAEILDFDRASDFIIVATTLLEIKSKKMLPRIEEELPDEIDEETNLIRKLQEYAIFKAQNEKLRSLETRNRFFIEPQYTDDDARLCIVDFNMEKLIAAYAKMLLRFENEVHIIKEKKIQKDRFTVADKILFVTNLLKDKKSVKFSELFNDDYTKGEMINTFLALLELLKRQMATAVQEDWGGDILIEGVEFDEDYLVKELKEYSDEEKEMREAQNGKS